ncbi:hypothetical protein B0H34DRAFT_669790 [Crassisporium funariophilum]|nr:hypothetical protein B0H34DRAFT_669790 [Crassisporium funariophilum]
MAAHRHQPLSMAIRRGNAPCCCPAAPRGFDVVSVQTEELGWKWDIGYLDVDFIQSHYLAYIIKVRHAHAMGSAGGHALLHVRVMSGPIVLYLFLPLSLKCDLPVLYTATFHDFSVRPLLLPFCLNKVLSSYLAAAPARHLKWISPMISLVMDHYLTTTFHEIPNWSFPNQIILIEDIAGLVTACCRFNQVLKILLASYCLLSLQRKYFKQYSCMLLDFIIIMFAIDPLHRLHRMRPFDNASRIYSFLDEDQPAISHNKVGAPFRVCTTGTREGPLGDRNPYFGARDATPIVFGLRDRDGPPFHFRSHQAITSNQWTSGTTDRATLLNQEWKPRTSILSGGDRPQS